jgi:hypothetical protein
MKRTAMQHTKVNRLVRALKVPRYAAVGILESLWHLTAREAVMGDIGRLTNADIADAIFWDGEPDALIAALIVSGWVDEDATCRLAIHDWREHADDTIKKAIARKREDDPGESGELFQTNSDKIRTEPDKSPLPLPLPLPLPEPLPEEQATASIDPEPDATTSARTPVSDADVERVYAAYPRKVGKSNAMAAIRKAVAHLASGKDWPALHGADAISLLHEKVTRYARSPAGSAGDFTPHPATWFNQARYLDDESEWQRGSNSANSTGGRSGGGNGFNQQNRGSRRVDDQLDELRKAGVTVPRGVPEAGSGEVCDPARRGDGCASPGIVLEGAG